MVPARAIVGGREAGQKIEEVVSAQPRCLACQLDWHSQLKEPQTLGALQLAIVGGYYTDRRVRELIGYPGQMALTLRSWEYPAYLEEGHIDAVLARGPSWRDPATGRRAVATGDEPHTYAELWSATEGSPEGGPDGHDGP